MSCCVECHRALNEKMVTALNCECLYCDGCYQDKILAKCLKCNTWIKRTVTFFFRDNDIQLWKARFLGNPLLK